MLLSDVVGAGAGFLLAIPPLTDQWRRRQELKQADNDDTAVPMSRQILAQAIREKRDSFNSSDTMLLACGAIGVVISFVLKMFDR